MKRLGIREKKGDANGYATEEEQWVLRGGKTGGLRLAAGRLTYVG